MKNIVITSGGTSEYIDKVRKITNSGTGKLGSIIADTFANNDEIENIFYIHTPKAFIPKTEKAILIEVTDTMSVKNAVEKVLTENKIDIFIHSMAISDYYVDYVSTIQMISNDLFDDNGFYQTSQVENILKNPKNRLDNSSKLSSSEDNLVVVLKQTPKIINIIKNISPETILVGFKLLENVTQEYLLDIASKLMNKNNCDYVVANDLQDIKSGNHKAFLLHKDKTFFEINGKQEIANKLVETILN